MKSTIADVAAIDTRIIVNRSSVVVGDVEAGAGGDGVGICFGGIVNVANGVGSTVGEGFVVGRGVGAWLWVGEGVDVGLGSCAEVKVGEGVGVGLAVAMGVCVGIMIVGVVDTGAVVGVGAGVDSVVLRMIGVRLVAATILYICHPDGNVNVLTTCPVWFTCTRMAPVSLPIHGWF